MHYTKRTHGVYRVHSMWNGVYIIPTVFFEDFFFSKQWHDGISCVDFNWKGEKNKKEKNQVGTTIKDVSPMHCIFPHLELDTYVYRPAVLRRFQRRYMHNIRIFVYI